MGDRSLAAWLWNHARLSPRIALSQIALAQVLRQPEGPAMPAVAQIWFWGGE